MVCSTVSENTELMGSLFSAKPVLFKPSIPNLVGLIAPGAGSFKHDRWPCVRQADRPPAGQRFLTALASKPGGDLAFEAPVDI